jgi:hypothetical protein
VGSLRSGQLGASVPPYVAAWLLREVRPERFTEQAALARAWRRPDLAVEVEFAHEQLRAARRAYARALEESARGDGQTETLVAETGAGSGVMDGMGTGQAAARLGCSRRRVRQHLAPGGALRGEKRGRAWVVDPGSVEDLLSLRRPA